MTKMTTSDMEIAAKYLRSNDVGDTASKACLRIAVALEARVSRSRAKIIAAAGKEPPMRAKSIGGQRGEADWRIVSKGTQDATG